MMLLSKNLELNAVWDSLRTHSSLSELEETALTPVKLPQNLIAGDNDGRFFVWSNSRLVLQSLLARSSLETSTPDQPGSADSSSSTCLSEKELVLSEQVTYPVRLVLLNATGLALALVGDFEVTVVDVSQLGHSAGAKGPLSCRAVRVGGSSLFGSSHGGSLWVAHAQWHPLSDGHLGVLTSDGVFRLFAVGCDAQVAEQEYRLQLTLPRLEPGSGPGWPVAFHFGGDRRWERFSVFFLFHDSSVTALCPVVPFGCRVSRGKVEELLSDTEVAKTQAALGHSVPLNAAFAGAWLTATFPYAHRKEDSNGLNQFLVAQPHVALDAVLRLQGPLPLLSSEGAPPGREGACALSCRVVGQDTLLAVAGAKGQVHLHALGGEVQPFWTRNRSPRIAFGEDGQIASVGMITETPRDRGGSSTGVVGGAVEEWIHGWRSWAGDPPGLFLVGSADLLLPPEAQRLAAPGLLPDPVFPQRLLCYHAMGVDAITCNLLPFSGGIPLLDLKADLLEVYPVLQPEPPPSKPGTLRTAHPSQIGPPVALAGVLLLDDLAGTSWLLAVSSTGRCRVQRLPLKGSALVGKLEQLRLGEGVKGRLKEARAELAGSLSKELLQGPKDIPCNPPQGAKELTLASVEGRAMLHDSCKLLHEKYLEYAHRAYVELAAHAKRLRGAVEEQAKEKQRLARVLEGEAERSAQLRAAIEERLDGLAHRLERLKACAALPALSQRPLTRPEKDYLAQLDTWHSEELPFLRMTSHEMIQRAQHLSEDLNVDGRTGGAPSVPAGQWQQLHKAVGETAQKVSHLLRDLQTAEATLQRRGLTASS